MGFIPEFAIAKDNAALYKEGELFAMILEICKQATMKYGSQQMEKLPRISSTTCKDTTIYYMIYIYKETRMLSSRFISVVRVITYYIM